MTNRTARIILAGLFLLAAAGPAAAQEISAEEKKLAKAEAGLEEDAAQPDGPKAVAERLKAEFKVDAARLDGLTEKKLGYGGAAVALALAEGMPGGVTDLNLRRVVELRQGPPVLGWGKVAQSLDLKLGPALSRVKKAAAGAHKAVKSEKAKREKREKREKAERAARPDRPGRVDRPGAGGLPGRPFLLRGARERGKIKSMDRSVAAREIMLLGAFEEARAAAARAGIELVPLKGLALLEAGIYRPGDRGMSDADLLLRPRDLAAFEELLRGLGYVPMENSADAWVKPQAGGAPPLILDIHTGLWHITDTDGLFDWGLEAGRRGPGLCLADLFIHAAAHPLLHHGELTPRALEDCARVAGAAPGDGEKFWAQVARKAEVYGLRAVLWPLVRRLAAGPFAVPVAALAALEPRGAEKIKAAFFERAAGKHSKPLEYLLPVLHRPGLLLRYAVPDRRFMERRYGSASAAAYALRPLRLLRAFLGR